MPIYRLVKGSELTYEEGDQNLRELALALTTSRTSSSTLALTDSGTVVEVSAPAACTITVPPNSAVAFPVGTVIEVCWTGTGQPTIAAGAGVTFRGGGSGVIQAQWTSAFLRKRGTDEWVLSGNLA